MSSDNALISFKAISNFTTCLSDVFGGEYRALKLYAHLINKTTIAHEKPIQKHIDAFREFCVQNRDAISNKDKKLIVNKIVYSERVYIDISTILNKADKETTDVIWKHLLTISAILDPTGRAKQILQESNKASEQNESDFLTNIINKVEENVDPDANPMEAVSSIMQSGVFTELVGGMGNGLQDGSLDLNKLMGTVQTMVTNLNSQMGDQTNSPNGEDNALSTMMNNLSANDKTSEGGGAPPDLSALIGMVGPMLNTLTNMQPGMPPGMPQGMPPGMPQGMPPGMSQGMPPGMPQGMPQGMPPGVPQVESKIDEIE